jgi:hypothetical protein
VSLYDSIVPAEDWGYKSTKGFSKSTSWNLRLEVINGTSNTFEGSTFRSVILGSTTSALLYRCVIIIRGQHSQGTAAVAVFLEPGLSGLSVLCGTINL